MPIKLDCPLCKQSLSVPRKKAGGHVRCPRQRRGCCVPGSPLRYRRRRAGSASAADAIAEPPSFGGDTPSDASWLSADDSVDSASGSSFRAGPARCGTRRPVRFRSRRPSAPPGHRPHARARRVRHGSAWAPLASPASTDSRGRWPFPCPAQKGLSAVPTPPPPAVSRPPVGLAVPPERVPVRPAGRPRGRQADPHRVAVVNIQPSPDGKLPELHLTEAEKPKAAETSSGAKIRCC